MTNVPIKPELVIWAREHRGLSQEELAEKLGLPLGDIEAIEAGNKVTNLTFFKRLSAKLKVPSGTLLRETPPDVPAMPADFRTHDGQPPKIGFEVRLAVSFARTLSENVRELVENELTDPLPLLPRLTRTNDPEESGEAERQRLGVSGVAQLGWSSGTAFRNWRSVIESAGTFVAIKNFPLDNCKGFTVYDHQNAPIIVLSKHEKLDVARTFTVLHEYGHLLLREPGFSDHDDRNPIEAWCNKFAAAFLMPRHVIRELIGPWPNVPIEWSIDDIRNWAARLKVSQQALALRFEGLGLAPEGFYGRIRAQQQQVTRARRSEGGNYVSTQVNELGDRYTKTVLNAENDHKIMMAEATELLAIRPVHFNRVRQQIDAQNTRVGVG